MNVDTFLDGLLTDLRARVRLLGDTGARRTIEDEIALIVRVRNTGLDHTRFERILAMLRAGLAPVHITLLAPQVIGDELTSRWRAACDGAATQQTALPARN